MMRYIYISGKNSQDYCPHLQQLPGWLLGGGIIFLLEFAFLVLGTKYCSGDGSLTKCCDFLRTLGLIALAAWAVFGNMIRYLEYLVLF